MVSVCIATYNGEQYIKDQVDSVLKQLSCCDELIVSDDGSTDSTINILESYQDSRIKIYYNNIRHGVIGNFENALRQVNGDYIFLSDQDDVWLPSKIERMLYYLRDYDLVLSDCKIVDVNLNILEDSFFTIISSKKGFFNNLAKNSYMGCCIAFKKDILSYILPFPKNIAMHDSWIGLSVELNGKPFFLEEPLILYRRHGNNASFTSGKSQYSFIYKVQYRLNMLFSLLSRRYKFIKNGVFC
jgi:glycosyltransferase, family 2